MVVRVLDELVNSHFFLFFRLFLHYNFISSELYLSFNKKQQQQLIEVQVIYLLFIMISPLVMSKEFPSGCKLTVSPDFLSTCK